MHERQTAADGAAGAFAVRQVDDSAVEEKCAGLWQRCHGAAGVFDIRRVLIEDIYRDSGHLMVRIIMEAIGRQPVTVDTSEHVKQLAPHQVEPRRPRRLRKLLPAGPPVLPCPPPATSALAATWIPGPIPCQYQQPDAANQCRSQEDSTSCSSLAPRSIPTCTLAANTPASHAREMWRHSHLI
jgi:hypothetical protein